MSIKPEKVTLQVSVPTRLDKALAAALPQVSRRQIRKWIDRGSVWVNRKRIRQQGYSLQPGQTYSVLVYAATPENTVSVDESPDWQARILYRDDALIAINKPAGIPAYPTQHSVTNSVFYILQRQGILPARARPFHRLDRAVSGVMVVPCTRTAAAELNAQMAQQKIHKRYLAWVQGHPETDRWEIRGYLLPPTPELPRARFFTTEQRGSRFSHTRFRVLWRDPTHIRTLVEAIPLTGRTHQIRIHLQVSGFPVLNDWQYGGPRFRETHVQGKIFLHHIEMRLTHPNSGTPMQNCCHQTGPKIHCKWPAKRKSISLLSGNELILIS